MEGLEDRFSVEDPLVLPEVVELELPPWLALMLSRSVVVEVPEVVPEMVPLVVEPVEDPTLVAGLEVVV